MQFAALGGYDGLFLRDCELSPEACSFCIWVAEVAGVEVHSWRSYEISESSDGVFHDEPFGLGRPYYSETGIYDRESLDDCFGSFLLPPSGP